MHSTSLSHTHASVVSVYLPNKAARPDFRFCIHLRGAAPTQLKEAAGCVQDGEQAGPSRRRRQPSMSETMPLYTLCKEDLDSMDREVRR